MKVGPQEVEEEGMTVGEEMMVAHPAVMEVQMAVDNAVQTGYEKVV